MAAESLNNSDQTLPPVSDRLLDRSPGIIHVDYVWANGGTNIIGRDVWIPSRSGNLGVIGNCSATRQFGNRVSSPDCPMHPQPRGSGPARSTRTGRTGWSLACRHSFQLQRLLGGEGGIAAQRQRHKQNQRLKAHPFERCVPVLCPEVEPSGRAISESPTSRRLGCG
jgi:hypothetical protein